MAHPILNDDWSDYDDRKQKDGKDKGIFSCTERWELDYLLNKLKKHFPVVSESAIRVAISKCCQNGNLKPREDFMKCVIGELSIFI